MTLPKFSTSRCWPKLPPTSQLWQTVSILIQLSSINWSSPKSPKRTVSWNDLLSPNCSYPVQWQLSQTAFHFLKSSCSFKCIQLGVNTNSTWVDDVWGRQEQISKQLNIKRTEGDSKTWKKMTSKILYTDFSVHSFALFMPSKNWRIKVYKKKLLSFFESSFDFI